MVDWYNGPGATGWGTTRMSLYGWTATPTFQINGSYQQLGWSQSSVQNYINTALALPCYLTIGSSYSGNAFGGTVTYTLTAEQDLGTTGQLKFWSAIEEDHDIATSGYGVYSGQELMWEPRAFPCGLTGQVVSFTGPYPQTITLTGSYTLDPTTMTFDNLNCVALLQMTTGDRRVLNASFMDLPDSNTGIGDAGTAPVGSPASLIVGPNPTSGAINIYTLLPTGTTGTVSVFDLDGRIVESFAAGGALNTTIETPGVYFVRLQTSSGEVQTRSCTVLR